VLALAEALIARANDVVILSQPSPAKSKGLLA
jgi:hypothetical protein